MAKIVMDELEWTESNSRTDSSSPLYPSIPSIHSDHGYNNILSSKDSSSTSKSTQFSTAASLTVASDDCHTKFHINRELSESIFPC